VQALTWGKIAKVKLSYIFVNSGLQIHIIYKHLTKVLIMNYVKKKLLSVLTMFAIVVVMVFIAGCDSSNTSVKIANIPSDSQTSSDQASNSSDASIVQTSNDMSRGTHPENMTSSGSPPKYIGDNRSGQRPSGSMGRPQDMTDNITSQEREAMMQERLQLEITACDGLSEGDSCNTAMTDPSGQEHSIEGICETRDTALTCRMQISETPGEMPTR
jgi:hypothetical protein